MTAVCPTLAAADGLRPRLLSGLCGAASDRVWRHVGSDI